MEVIGRFEDGTRFAGMTMDRLIFSCLAFVVCGASLSLAQAPDAAIPLRHGRHQISKKQVRLIREKEDARSDRGDSTGKAFVPGSSRGRSLKSADEMHQIYGRMSRRDRGVFFGVAKTALRGQEINDALDQGRELVFHEIFVTETDQDPPLIDVDGDGTLDHVDVLRYSSPETHNHRLCGPTIVMRRNQKLVIHLKNQLKASREPVMQWNPGSEPPEPPEAPAYWMMDAPHELFSTNMHTHGLHISSGGGHDNSFLTLGPTRTEEPNELFLDYQLPANHVAGTFWYHAHRHGSVAYQLANGMAGALIVLGDEDPTSPDLESLPEIQAANQIKHPTDSTQDVEYGRVMLLQQLVFTKTSVTVKDQDGADRPRWIVDPADVNDRKSALPESNEGRITEGIPPNKPDPDEFLAVNGQASPSIEIQRGQIERWRLIHAGRESALNLAWYHAADLKDPSNSDPPITDTIETYEIATDGIPTGRLSKLTNVELYPGYRSDILVRVTDKALDGEYWLLPSEAKRLVRTHLGPVQNSTPVAKLFVKGALDRPMRLPAAAKLDRLKRPVPDMTGAQTLNLNFTFADKLRFGVANQAHGPGKPYSESGSAESIAIPINTPQVWYLGVHEFLPGVNEAVKHPFHIHVNPFYVPTLGVWKDTLAISREEVTKVYFVPQDFAGRSVLHCHILDHEDQGMMKDINIVGASRSQYPELYQLERVPDSEQASVSSLQLESGKNNVLVFITGMDCPHCAEGLVKLWKRSDPLKNFNATIQCLSAMSFEQSDLTNLGVAEKDHFTFQSVPKGFELSQLDTTPKLRPTNKAGSTPSYTHGVVIFDRNQKLRFRYLGDRPLNDLDEITYALMELNPVQSAVRRRQNPSAK